MKPTVGRFNAIKRKLNFGRRLGKKQNEVNKKAAHVNTVVQLVRNLLHQLVFFHRKRMYQHIHVFSCLLTHPSCLEPLCQACCPSQVRIQIILSYNVCVVSLSAFFPLTLDYILEPKLTVDKAEMG